MNETLPKLVLQANVPKYLTLAFDTPREGDTVRRDGSSNHWYLYTVVDEVGVNYSYFPPETINAYLWLEKKGYAFTLLELATIENGRARKNTQIWEGWVDVQQATPLNTAAQAPQSPPTPPPQPPRQAPPVSRPAPPVTRPPRPPTALSQARPSAPPTPPPQKQSVRLSDVANTMEACIIAASDIAAVWPAEQQQAVAVSMFISIDKAGSYLTREQVKATAAFYAGGIPENATKYGGEDAEYDTAPPVDEGDVDFSDEPGPEEGVPF